MEIALEPSFLDLWLWRKSVMQGLRDCFGDQVSVNQGFDKVMVIALYGESSLKQLILEVEKVLNQLQPADSLTVSKWNIPICYHHDTEDLRKLVHQLSLPATDIIKLHQEATYRVEFIGFLPGFPYLSGLPELLNVPRKETPSPRIASGSVAIAAGMCGIYPQSSPGGWYVLGESPLPFFDVRNENPVFMEAGDEVHFYAVDAAESEKIKNQQFEPSIYRHE